MNRGAKLFGVALLAPITVLYALFLLAPIGNFLATSLYTYDAIALYKPVLTGANFSRLIFDPYYRAIILLTMKIALLSTVFSLVIGFPLAYFLARTQSAWRGLLMFLVVAPLMTGVIVRTYGWIVLLGTEGTVNSIIVGLGLVERPVRILNTEAAVVIALVHILLPYMVFPLFSALIAQDPNLSPAAATLGAGPARIFFEVTLPLSRSGILMGSALVFTLAAGAVVTPALLGGKDVQMMGQTIYDLVLHTLNWPLAAAFASLLILLQFAIIFLYLGGGRRAVGSH